MILNRTLSLFWRSFGLLFILLCVGFGLWSHGESLRQEHPRAQALARQLVTAVNLTRTAITHTQSNNRVPLLLELNADEQVGVFVREETDVVVPLDETAIDVWLSSLLQARLGQNTQLAREVNGITGLWISFDMGGNTLGLNTYWLRVDPERMEARLNNPTLWWLWLFCALAIAALAAAWMTQRITKPLSDLAQRTQALSQGLPYIALPDSRLKEIAQVNAGMNRMAEALQRQESDRRLMLAGLSHDLRTPLARLRLELEFAPLDAEQRAAMNGDISQIDAQLKQFTDYVGSDQAQLVPVNLTELLHQIASRYSRDPRCHLTVILHNDLMVQGDAALLTRLFSNLIENACRYGKTPLTPDALVNMAAVADITMTASLINQYVLVDVIDKGQGVSPEQLPALLEPFVRGDAARAGTEGSGLGLAIVARIAKRHGAILTLHSAVHEGFRVQLQYPLAKP